MTSSQILTFIAGRVRQNFVVEEIACISYSKYKTWVKVAVIIITAIFAVALFTVKPIMSVIPIVIMSPVINEVFRQFGYIATTGGRSTYKAKWSTFENISSQYLIKSSSNNVHVEDSTFIKKYLHVINPDRVSSFKYGSTDKHNKFFGGAIVLAISLIWLIKYSPIIIPLIGILIIIGFLVWEKGIRTEMVGGHKSFFLMSRRHANEIIKDLQKTVSGSSSTNSYSITKDPSWIDALAVCSLVVLVGKIDVKLSDEDSKVKTTQIFTLLKAASADENIANNSLKEGISIIKKSGYAYDEVFRTYADKFTDMLNRTVKYSKIGTKYKTIGTNLIDALVKFSTKDGNPTKGQQELIDYIKAKMPT